MLTVNSKNVVVESKNMMIKKRRCTSTAVRVDVKYIFRQDADDISLPKRLEIQLNFMENICKKVNAVEIIKI